MWREKVKGDPILGPPTSMKEYKTTCQQGALEALGPWTIQ